MNLYLDTEFNTFHGPLISMAVVPEDGLPFYEVLHLPNRIDPWVAQNVVPQLGKDPIRGVTFQSKLWQWMIPYNGADIYADWPEDIAHLANWLCAPNGKQLDIQLRFHLIKSGKLCPAVPHNALSDAIALKEWHLNDQGSGTG
jgi:hypothetical protein